MASEPSVSDAILQVLRPYASNFSGTLGRGDLVIPQREIPRVIRQILAITGKVEEQRQEASELEVFQALARARRLQAMQDEVAQLRREFVILKR